MNAMEKDHIKQHYVGRNTLCRTIAGNKVDYLTITAKNHPDAKAERKGVFLSARVHPGETNSSWMMKGAIDFLLSQAPEAYILREKFVFKIVPMLNPDGVINGNYRCSLSGADLNRRWKTSSKILFPEIFETKRLVKTF
jgi:murein tripeptide amidase MpaA